MAFLPITGDAWKSRASANQASAEAGRYYQGLLLGGLKSATTYQSDRLREDEAERIYESYEQMDEAGSSDLTAIKDGGNRAAMARYMASSYAKMIEANAAATDKTAADTFETNAATDKDWALPINPVTPPGETKAPEVVAPEVVAPAEGEEEEKTPASDERRRDVRSYRRLIGGGRA